MAFDVKGGFTLFAVTERAAKASAATTHLPVYLVYVAVYVAERKH